VNLVANGSADLGMVSRRLKEAEQSQVEAIAIGYSATGLATNAANPVAALTKKQGREVFSGVITDWSAVGGKPGRIIVLVREVDSATRISVESYFFGGTAAFATDAVEVHDIEETLRSIRSFKDAVGMLSVNALTLSDPTMRFLAIDGVAPTAQSVRNGTYPIRRELYLLAHPTTLKPAIRAFLDFVRSPAGQKIVAEN
jgi:phosphate transport system substrate-binding protein